MAMKKALLLRRLHPMTRTLRTSSAGNRPRVTHPSHQLLTDLFHTLWTMVAKIMSKLVLVNIAVAQVSLTYTTEHFAGQENPPIFLQGVSEVFSDFLAAATELQSLLALIGEGNWEAIEAAIPLLQNRGT